jgi:hypothetical protein
MMRSKGSRSRGPHLRLLLATAGTAAGASQHRGGGTYTVTPPRLGSAGRCPVTDPTVNAWGVWRAHDAVVGRQQRH